MKPDLPIAHWRHIAMLIHSLYQIGCDANVKRAVRLVGQYINARLFLLSHLQSLTAKWTLKQVQGDGVVQNQRHPEFISGSIARFIQFKLNTPQSQLGFARTTI
jgi:hypothetical protein